MGVYLMVNEVRKKTMSKRLETPSERPILSIRDRVQGFDVTAENNKYLLSMIRPAALHEARRQAEEVGHSESDDDDDDLPLNALWVGERHHGIEITLANRKYMRRVRAAVIHTVNRGDSIDNVLSEVEFCRTQYAKDARIRLIQPHMPFTSQVNERVVRKRLRDKILDIGNRERDKAMVLAVYWMADEMRRLENVGAPYCNFNTRLGPYGGWRTEV